MERTDAPFQAIHIGRCQRCGVVFTSHVTPPEVLCEECRKPPVKPIRGPKA